MKIMVSACLLGDNVKYNGGNNRHEKVLEYIKGHEVVPVCPEMLGGLPVPRAPGEIQDGIVRNEDGTSVDYEYRTGAAKALEIAESERIDMAILQSRSPSCGVNQIYDGSFTGRKIKGMGVFARLLSEKGYKVVDAEDI
ncbi:MAG: DUF523 domain-containing protein [Bacillota bacterium]|nr:DUF523 domain-containing protein [Bacillota bacterium]MDO4471710.1 DUF523 domain-containing protein [Bacillota bacterium]